MYNFGGVFSMLESDMTLILLFGDVLENTDGVVLKILIFSCNFFLSFLGETFRLLELELSSFVLRGWLCSYKKEIKVLKGSCFYRKLLGVPTFEIFFSEQAGGYIFCIVFHEDLKNIKLKTDR